MYYYCVYFSPSLAIHFLLLLFYFSFRPLIICPLTEAQDIEHNALVTAFPCLFCIGVSEIGLLENYKL